jgi:hypothetical protein
MISAQPDIDHRNRATLTHRGLQQVAWLQLAEGDRTRRSYRGARDCARVPRNAGWQIDSNYRNASLVNRLDEPRDMVRQSRPAADAQDPIDD